MAGTVIHTVPDTMITRYYAVERTAISTWLSFRNGNVPETIVGSLEAAAKAGAKTMVVDVSGNPGVLNSSDLEFTMTTALEHVKSKGFTAFVNVVGTDALTRIGSRQWKRNVDSAGIPTFECATVEGALALAAELSSGRRPAA
jgi:hypothetical protein